MIQLSFFVAAGFVALLAFILLGLQGPGRMDTDHAALAAVTQMINLEGTSFIRGDLLMDDADYRVLRSNPDLRSVASQMRRDRRELALLWIGTLLGDLKTLRRFRRFLILHGAPTSFHEEWLILRNLFSAIIFLNVLRISVITFGPFAFSRISRRASHPVDVVSGTLAHVLGRIPSASWPDLHRAWMSIAA